MSVTKDKNTGKWMSQIRIKDWTGKEIHKKKRGFSTKQEALNHSVLWKVPSGCYQTNRHSQMAKRTHQLP